MQILIMQNDNNAKLLLQHGTIKPFSSIAALVMILNMFMQQLVLISLGTGTKACFILW